MKSNFWLSTLVLLLLLSSCKFLPQAADKKSLVGLWNISSAEGSNFSLAEEKAFLNLRADNSYTFYLPDYFDYGSWKYDAANRVVVMNSERSKPLYFKKWEFSVGSTIIDNKLQAQLPGASQLLDFRLDSAHTYERVSFRMSSNLVLTRNEFNYDPKADPFSLQYNKWRIRPDHKESCEELKSRVINHIQHLNLLFEGYTKANASEVSYDHSPSLFEMASNGIGMKPYDAVSYDYKYTFYNEEDAVNAYFLTEGIFRQNLKFPKKHEKYSEYWSFLLKQMAEKGAQADLCGVLEKRYGKKRE